MEKCDLIIIGAGISGLSLAHYAARAGLKTLVLEKAEEAGGCLSSHRFEGAASGFWLELGAHTCYNSYGNLLGIMEDCKILDRIIRREKAGFKMLVDNEIRSIPSQIGFLELLLSAPRILTLKKEGLSIESYYSKIVGRRNFERVFGPAFNAVLSQKADDFPAEMLFKKRPRRKDILKSFTLKGGIRTITDSIISQQKFVLEKGVDVQGVTFDGHVFGVMTADGKQYESQGLALATPPHVAAKLLQSSFPDVSSHLAQIKIESVDTVGVVVKKRVLSVGPLAGIIAVHDSFYSAVSRDTVPHEHCRGFSFHFKAGRLDHDAKIKRIAEVLRIGNAEIEGVVTKENLVPSLSVGHDRLTEDTDRFIAGKRLFLTGNYFNGLAIEDCVSRSLSEFTRLKDVFKETRQGLS
ncbi:MAG TPA: FAD-dependent oxidoreductase [Thermodesulfovibrionales bacterium]|jgi:protoporphyrinogen oxidase|nr:FAD-dependent oxidoreductase [Thermodesulfovibrionales bacterium]